MPLPYEVNIEVKLPFFFVKSQMKILSFFKSVFFGIPIGITLVDSVGYVARVDGISMQPALNPDRSTTDYVFLSKLAVRTFDVQRGDIVSLTSPKDPAQKIIKRVVGIQGKRYSSAQTSLSLSAQRLMVFLLNAYRYVFYTFRRRGKNSWI